MSVMCDVHSLEYEIEMLKDQLQQASKGTTVPTEVYQQLSTLEAAYAKLQEDKVPRHWGLGC